ncbi:hypothetical protein K402DRAFT_372870 [Aulographum hederae CBS 113979]|uniref:V-SNARE coiled-coil homology domain-containing protein n=1 Tax=Aulographum hederae CBS 113979 TaxID=1176131 RepID=A0A6G1H827_9PEZI|nr:hypothetical protein K402DRAFT_372870 [Aulographum hederae CBS 113979]
MAEALAAVGVAASIAQLADYGLQLSVKLFTFGNAVYNADRSVQDISNDVSLTSSVLKELGDALKKDDEARLFSEQAVLAAEKTVSECLKIFSELDEALKGAMGRLGLDEKGGKVKVGKTGKMFEKLKWPFLQPKMELLRSNLERLKASLSLMLNVLIYARGIYEKRPEDDSQHQKEIIEALARSERESQQRFESLRKALQSGNDMAKSAPPFSQPTKNGRFHPQASDSPGFSINAIAVPQAEPEPLAVDLQVLKTDLFKYCELITELVNELHGASATEPGKEESVQLGQEIARASAGHVSRLRERYLQSAGPRKYADSLLSVDFEKDEANDIFIASSKMRDFVLQATERGERLDGLQDTTDNLAVSAQGFRRGANRVRKQMWWKDIKTRLALLALFLLLCLFCYYVGPPLCRSIWGNKTAAIGTFLGLASATCVLAGYVLKRPLNHTKPPPGGELQYILPDDTWTKLDDQLEIEKARANALVEKRLLKRERESEERRKKKKSGIVENGELFPDDEADLLPVRSSLTASGGGPHPLVQYSVAELQIMQGYLESPPLDERDSLFQDGLREFLRKYAESAVGATNLDESREGKTAGFQLEVDYENGEMMSLPTEAGALRGLSPDSLHRSGSTRSERLKRGKRRGPARKGPKVREVSSKTDKKSLKAATSAFSGDIVGDLLRQWTTLSPEDCEVAERQ